VGLYIIIKGPDCVQDAP